MNDLSALPLSYKGLIFDCDGVLVDTEPLHGRTWIELLGRYGVSYSWEEFSRFLGQTSPQMIRTLVEEGKIPAHLNPRALIDERRDLFWERLEEGIEEIPGSRDFLTAMAPRASLALATSNLRATIERILRIMDWTEAFDATVGIDDVGHPKPEPDIYLEAVERLGLPASACLVFEDSVPGIQAARAAGLEVVGLTTSHPAETLLEHGVRAVLDDFTDPAALARALDQNE